MWYIKKIQNVDKNLNWKMSSEYLCPFQVFDLAFETVAVALQLVRLLLQAVLVFFGMLQHRSELQSKRNSKKNKKHESIEQENADNN